MRTLKTFAAAAFTALCIYSCESLPTGPEQIPDTPYLPQTPVGALLRDCASVGNIYADSCFTIIEGVEETDIHLQTMEGKVQHVYILKVDISADGIGLKVGMPYGTGSVQKGRRQTPSAMARYADAPGSKVIAAVNGDFWDTVTDEIRGPVHYRGNILKDTFIYSSSLSDQAISFFGFDGDGCPVIRDSLYYRQMQSSLVECTGSGVIVLRDGKVPGDFSAYSSNRHPRTCAGYTADGKTVWFLVCDGRQTLWSEGMLYWEMGEIMKSLGCAWATNLDGGGSSQLVVRDDIMDYATASWTLRNRASDGAERAVVNIWMVVSGPSI